MRASIDAGRTAGAGGATRVDRLNPGVAHGGCIARAGARMTVLRNRSRDRFTVITAAAIADRRLSFRALGLLVYCLGKPDGWSFSADRIAADRREGRDAVRAGFRDLRDAGYVKVVTHRDRRGRITREVVVSEVPTRDGKPAAGASCDDGTSALFGPGTGNPAAGAPGDLASTESQDGEVNNARTLPFAQEFAECWALYPRKVARKGAHKAYVARRRAGVEHARLLAAVRHYAQAVEGRDVEHVMHGSTFFGVNDRWVDYEHPPVPVGGSPPLHGELERARAAGRPLAPWERS